MNKHELSQLLTIVSMIDNRTVASETVEEWHRVIGHLDFADAREAAETHFAESLAYLMPVHVVAGVLRVRHARNARPVTEFGDGGKVRAPQPANLVAMVAAWDDPARFALECSRYNRQLVDAGFQPYTRFPVAARDAS